MERRRIETSNAPPSTGFRSQGLVVANYLFVSGMIGSSYTPGGEVRTPAPTLAEQADLALNHLATVTRAAAADIDRVVEVAAFIVPPDGARVVRSRVETFLRRVPPLFNVAAVTDVAAHGLLELDWIASLDRTVPFDKAAEPLAAFGHGEEVVAGTPFVTLNGLRVAGASMADETRQLFAKADERLRHAGSRLDQVVKLAVYIADFASYPEFNQTTRELFAAFTPPARSVVVAPALTGTARLKVDLLALAP